MRNYNRNPLRIFIGVGHGGGDPGAVNEKLGLAESGINLTIALLMERDLKRHGVQVMLSRYTDEDDRLKEEIAECNAYAPDFALEIHINAGGGTGFEVYYKLDSWEHSKVSLEMARLFDTNVQKHL
ncbi:MAG: N-acetylmuramoyl-L-alanine amidase, partial [Peptococcaceae bacterium]|nr:N-acetylmuramoyl-L-alanine amidase [Peptococcaceae bacterium]